jgi:hypothetical protein
VTKPSTLTHAELLAHFANEVRELGGQLHWAQAAGVRQGYVADVLRGRREPGPKILAALGYKRVTHYEPVED